jgi:hypothetical protein
VHDGDLGDVLVDSGAADAEQPGDGGDGVVRPGHRLFQEAEVNQIRVGAAPTGYRSATLKVERPARLCASRAAGPRLGASI